MPQEVIRARTGSWLLDLATGGLSWSAGLCEVFGLAVSHTLSVADFLAQVHPDDRAEVGQRWQKKDDVPVQFIYRVLDMGAPRWLHETIESICAADGIARQRVGNVRDITEQKHLEVLLKESEEYYRNLLEEIEVGVVLQDANCKILASNQAALDLLGLTEDQLLGKTSFDPSWNAIRDDGSPFPSSEHPAPRSAATGQSIKSEVMGVYRPLTDDRVWLSVNAKPLLNFDGSVRQVIVTFIDFTETRLHELQLRRSTNRLALATKAGGVGIWDWDVVNNELVWDNEMFGLYGGTRDQFIGAYDAWLKGVHPDDRERGDAEIKAALSGEKEFDTEFRVLWPSGDIRFIHALAIVERDSSGQAVRMVGTNWDVTEQRRQTEELNELVQEKTALLREVHHRVKNNLQVVNSLLRLEAGRNEHPETQAVLDVMQGRIYSMALLHETLYRSNKFASVDIGVYLEQLAGQSIRTMVSVVGQVQFHVDVISVQTDADRAISCGLLVNELISNSLKHGFPEGRTGEIWLSLQHADDDQLRLIIRDTGVGLPLDFAERREKQLGMQLVSDLAGQIGGRLDIGSGSGAEFIVTFKANSITK